MQHNNDFIQKFMAYYKYPAEAVECFTGILDRLDNEPDFAAIFDAAGADYMNGAEEIDLHRIYSQIDPAASERGISPYSIDFVFLMTAAQEMKRRYAERGLPEQLFWDTLDDMRSKLYECIECEEVPGTFVGTWFGGFFELTMFKYGRFEYHFRHFDFEEPFKTSYGIMLNPGDLCVNMHIPSHGPSLTDEVRLDSYKKAYAAFHDKFPDGIIRFTCGSWLLFPKHREFLHEGSNIVKFLNDFEIISWAYKQDFHDGWRIFNKYSDEPVDKLPRDTALRREYADWLSAGNMAGDGFGIMLFDGEKILR